MAAAEDIEDILEAAFWRFDALHKSNYRDVDPKLLGPMSERDAFKGIVRKLVNDVLGKNYVRSLAAPSGGPARG